jgi:ornithine carbamoyltransferase
MMQYSNPSTRSWSLATLPAGEQQRVADLAASLAEASRSGRALQPLRGKNLAVLCESPSCAGSEVIFRAASALGARVTHIRPSDALNAPARGPDAVGSLLGRLYDAIDCYGVAPEMIDRLVQTTGRPVFNALGEQPTTTAHDTRNDEFTLQALLVSALASH